jgi:hypothetical protein
MARPRNPADPTEERTADQSTQSASGLTAGRPDRIRPGNAGPTGSRGQAAEDDDLIARNEEERHQTPRRYDERADEDAAMPSNDSTLNTKI